MLKGCGGLIQEFQVLPAPLTALHGGKHRLHMRLRIDLLQQSGQGLQPGRLPEGIQQRQAGPGLPVPGLRRPGQRLKQAAFPVGRPHSAQMVRRKPEHRARQNRLQRNILKGIVQNPKQRQEDLRLTGVQHAAPRPRRHGNPRASRALRYTPALLPGERRG